MTPFRPRVTVVIPARDVASTLGPCVESLLAQTYPRELTEIIVVDNDSSDATARVAARYPVICVVEKTRTGAAARNRGVSNASGDVLAFIDADCVASPGWIAELVPPPEDRRIGATVGSIDDAAPRSICEEFVARVRPYARPQPKGIKTVLTGNVAVRRNTFDECGGFDEALPTAADVDFGWRIQQLGLLIVEASEARVAHRHRSTFRGAFRQFRRYGLSEVLLATIHPSGPALRPAQQLRRMCSQFRAIGTYLAGLLYRSAIAPFRGFDRRFVAWPVFLLFVEVGNVVGKIDGLIRTRGCRRNPFPNARLGRNSVL